MLEIFNFIKLHWEFILSIILIILSFILTLIKKKPISTIEEEIYYLACLGTKRAEESGLKGYDKLTLALNFVCNSLKNKYPGINVQTYQKLIIMIIEEILTTPQKK